MTTFHFGLDARTKNTRFIIGGRGKITISLLTGTNNAVKKSRRDYNFQFGLKTSFAIIIGTDGDFVSFSRLQSDRTVLRI